MNEDVRTSRVVYATTDYDSFKVLCGNRGVDLQRVAKIKKSIENTYVPCPIVVNEKMEVIDGQGRLQALKELGLPVYYVVVQGANLDDCIRMNITSTPWEAKDYIYSGRDRGNENYAKLALLIDRYAVGKRLSRGLNGSKNVLRTSYSVPLDIILASAEGNVSAGSHRKGQNTLQNGLFIVKEDMDKIIGECDYISSFYKVVPMFGVAAKILLFAKRCAEVDEIRLRNQIITYQKNRDIFPAYTNTSEGVLAFEAVYNYRLKAKIDMRALYNKYNEEYGGTAGKAWNARRKD